MKRWLLLFAAEMERDAAFEPGPPDGLDVGITGVGIVDAGIGAVKLIAEHRPDVVVFVGTCGAYPESGIETGDIVVATGARLSSGDVAHGAMRIPKLLPSELSTDDHLTQVLYELARLRFSPASVHAGGVASTLGITEAEGLARLLGSEEGSVVENLESFSVLRAADEIPTAIVLAVTNIVGPEGGKEWAANFRRLLPHAGALAVQAANVLLR